MDLIYRYTGQGYREWTRFVHPDDLNVVLVSYIGPMSSQKLYSYGIAAQRPSFLPLRVQWTHRGFKNRWLTVPLSHLAGAVPTITVAELATNIRYP